MQRTLGGDRLGSGKRMKVDLHGYERSTHDLGYLFRTTMASGPLVPFLYELGTPGDTFDINLNAEILTHPTIGPLFGSYKVQLDVFMCPIRLYQAKLHNSKLGIGMKMSDIKLPIMTLTATNTPDDGTIDLDNAQINPSCILAYLGIRGVGTVISSATQSRDFQALGLLAYWDIYKNYYANKMEEVGAVIHNALPAAGDNTTSIHALTPAGTLMEIPLQGAPGSPVNMGVGYQFRLAVVGTQDITSILLQLDNGNWVTLQDLSANGVLTNIGSGFWTTPYDFGRWGYATIRAWRNRTVTDTTLIKPTVHLFDLENLDTMRELILADVMNPAPFSVNMADLEPYKLVLGESAGQQNMMNTQEGLALKTYQSDLHNNWLNEEWIDGSNGISEVTKISTAGDAFTIDAFLLGKKVYDMLNRIMVSGGTYKDWVEVVWGYDYYTQCESPIYMGGLSKELVFQEVVSNSQSIDQPLGSIAGRGVLSNKHKGGYVHIRVEEPSIILGLVSITPRIDYSQGNSWINHLKTVDDIHKPGMDGIGFQDLVTEQMAWWDTAYIGGVWAQRSAGKQPAWINYMTNVNKVYGNFAIKDNEMFMTLNRRYEAENAGGQNFIKDLTSYIDPVKFNNIFAERTLDAQNFWTQISVDMIGRRIMSAKVMPNI